MRSNREIEQNQAYSQDYPIKQLPGDSFKKVASRPIQGISTSKEGIPNLAGTTNHHCNHWYGHIAQVTKTPNKTARTRVDSSRKLRLVNYFIVRQCQIKRTK